MNNSRYLKSGFTLVEVIVAFVISAIVILIGSLALRTSLLQWNKSKDIFEFNQRVLFFSERLKNQFRLSVPYMENKGAFFLGDEKGFSFITTDSNNFYSGAVQLYYRYNERDKTFNGYFNQLVSEEDIKDMDEMIKGDPFVSMVNVESFSIKYYTKDVGYEDLTWKDKVKDKLTDNSSVIPALILIDMNLKYGDKNIEKKRIYLSPQ